MSEPSRSLGAHVRRAALRAPLLGVALAVSLVALDDELTRREPLWRVVSVATPLGLGALAITFAEAKLAQRSAFAVLGVTLSISFALLTAIALQTAYVFGLVQGRSVEAGLAGVFTVTQWHVDDRTAIGALLYMASCPIALTAVARKLHATLVQQGSLTFFGSLVLGAPAIAWLALREDGRFELAFGAMATISFLSTVALVTAQGVERLVSSSKEPRRD